MWSDLYRCTLLYMQNLDKLTKNEKKNIYNKIKRVWNVINWKSLSISNIKKRLFGINFNLYYILFKIKYAK